MGRRTIACMTATRADYPRVKPVLREIARRPGLDLKLIVTGAHLSRAFGHTVDLIERDGFEIAQRVPMYAEDARGRGDSVYDMTKATARCMDGMADALRAIAPDLFLITVDRVETLAAAAGALMNLPLFHIQGGEVTGTIDESIRHAVTKLAHVHFPATPDAAERITHCPHGRGTGACASGRLPLRGFHPIPAAATEGDIGAALRLRSGQAAGDLRPASGDQ
ncbi:MAG: hypothetical protein G8D28_08170 [gamma proteobacterium symbiont of Phacoides pectinatus]